MKATATPSVGVLHATGFSNGQVTTGGLQDPVAHLLFLTRGQALGRAVMRAGHSLMTGDVDRPFLVIVRRSCCRKRRYLGNKNKGKKHFFHKITCHKNSNQPRIGPGATSSAMALRSDPGKRWLPLASSPRLL
jgi:hypothetical protein